MYSPQAIDAMKKRQHADWAKDNGGPLADLFEHHADVAERRVIEDRDPVLREANRRADEDEREKIRESVSRTRKMMDRITGKTRMYESITDMMFARKSGVSIEKRIRRCQQAILQGLADKADWLELRQLLAEANALQIKAARKLERRLQRAMRHDEDNRSGPQERDRLRRWRQEVCPPTVSRVQTLACPHGPDVSGVPLAA